MQTTITLKEANRKVDRYIEQAQAQLPPRSRLEERLRFEDSPCTDPDDHGPQGRKIAERSYEVTGIESSKIRDYFDTLKRWWTDNDFSVLDDDPPYKYLTVENNIDGVRLALQANDQGHLYLMASSPCVWPNGTPDPDAAAAEDVD